MIAAGIDVGNLTTKLVFLEDSKIRYQKIVTTAESAEAEMEKIINQGLNDTNLSRDDVKNIVVTGSGRKKVAKNLQKHPNVCLVKGTRFLFPSGRTIIKVGAENCTAIRIDEDGKIIDYILQDKCAAGTGSFFESMANLLSMSLGELSKSFPELNPEVEFSNTCAIFIEQEIISHIHNANPTPINEIIAALNKALAVRVCGLAKRVRIEPEVVLCGGVMKNASFAKMLTEETKVEAFIPEEPQIVAALGAALYAREGA